MSGTRPDAAAGGARRWPRFATVLGVIVLVGAVLFVFAWVPQVFLYTFFAVLIGVLLQSAARFVARSGLPYGLSLTAVILAILGLFAGFGFLFGSTIASQLGQIAERIPETLSNFESRLDETPLGRQLMERIPLVESGEASGAAVGDEQPGAASDAGSALMGADPFSRLAALMGGFVSVFGHFFYVVIIGIFLAAAPQLYRTGARMLFPVRQEDRASQVMDDLYHTLRAWLVGQLVAMVFVGAAVAIGLSVLGVPFALGLGFIAFLFEFIPTIGPWIAGVPAVLVAFTQGPTTALWVALLFVAIELIEGNVLLPLVYEQTVELPPALTLFAIFLLGSLFGFVGVLVAAPLTAVVVTLVRTLYLPGATDEAEGDEAEGDEDERNRRESEAGGAPSRSGA